MAGGTPKAWQEAAKRVLERQNARIEPEYEVIRRDSARNVAEARLFAVSLDLGPVDPHCLAVRSVDD